MDTGRKIADFVVETTYEAFPSRVLEAARIAILDSVGVTLAGSSRGVRQAL